MGRGFTLIELVLVLLILSLTALLAAPRYGRLGTGAKIAAAESDLAALRGAILGAGGRAGFLTDMENIPRFLPVNPLADRPEYECLNLRVHNLFCPTNLQTDTEMAAWRSRIPDLPDAARAYDPDARRGWRGPYLGGGRQMDTDGAGRRPDTPAGRFPGPRERRFPRDRTFFERGFYRKNGARPGDSPYGIPGECALADPWGNPYLVQVPAPAAFPPEDRPPPGRLDKAFARRRWRYARLVSAGPDGILDTPRDLCAGRAAHSLAARGDDLVLFLNRADCFEDPERK